MLFLADDFVAGAPFALPWERAVFFAAVFCCDAGFEEVALLVVVFLAAMSVSLSFGNVGNPSGGHTGCREQDSSYLDSPLPSSHVGPNSGRSRKSD
jgi:hypothetical protein